MYKVKMILRKIFRMENRENPTAHQMSDREMFAAINEANKDGIEKVRVEDERLEAIAFEERMAAASALAAKNKKAQEVAKEKERVAKSQAKHKAANDKFKEKRLKEQKKTQDKRDSSKKKI